MYYSSNYKLILINYFNIFNKNLINYFTGFYNEDEFKVFRLQYGIYRQKISYMCRFAIPHGQINPFQFFIFSYISLFYDRNYFHLTTRSNFQFNWLKIFFIFEIFKKLSYLFLHSIQTSGNCVRNITSSFKYNDLLKFYSWCELIRQWFTFNFEFLFLPRKFKISILFQKRDDVVIKTNDLGLYVFKNNSNVINFNILVGGGMGRTPLLGIYIFKNVHWKNILNYINKVLVIYNTFGFRNNIYKSRLKILIKSIKFSNFLNFIFKEFNFSNIFIYLLDEKEFNYFFFNFDIFNNNYLLKKKIFYNYFFLNWLKINYKKFFLFLPLKANNKAPGDINYIQVKIIFYFFKNIKFLKTSIRQNIIFLNYDSIYFIFLKLKKYFFNIFNLNTITDIISCPGKDYCVLANSKSIAISKLINYIFTDFNTISKIGNFFLNISGCINSCAHHHVSNIGFLGVNKDNKDNYQMYLGGNFNNYESLIFSKILTSSFIYFKVSYYLIKVLKIFLKNYLYKKIFNFDMLKFKSNF
ncbi:MAG: hypothetical protein ACSHUF_00315 [Candidatus Nasuia deltocephalinicola]